MRYAMALAAMLLAGPARAQTTLVIIIPHVTREECLNAGATWNEPSGECISDILPITETPMPERPKEPKP